MSSIDAFKSTTVQEICHVTITLPVSFDAFVTAWESTLGRYYRGSVAAAKNFADIERIVTSQLNGLPFAIFEISDHGMLATARKAASSSSTPGKVLKAKRYEFGNPLFASSMTMYDVRAGQYAPLTMLVWENERGEAVCQWDSAEDLMGKGTEGRGEVVEVSGGLDRKREEIVRMVFEKARCGG